jgi:hypothetical protein
MKRWQPVVLTLAFCASLALAEEEAEDATESAEAVEKVCVNKRNISSFDAIDDQHIYIKASGQRHFLFTMRNRCFGLRNANTIGIKETMSRVCSNGFGEVIYRDMGRSLQSCYIGTIEAVANKDDARGLIADRKQLKEEEREEKKAEK